jgi:hypothetical protein
MFQFLDILGQKDWIDCSLAFQPETGNRMTSAAINSLD